VPTALVDTDAIEALPFPSAPIEEMLRLLAKGVRAHQLYLHNNPTYLRAIELLRASFLPIWEHTDAFTLTVTDTAFLWEGVSVHQEHGGDAAESVPWTFYKDGVRELQFQKGFEDADLPLLLDVIQRARRNGPEGDDLLVMLWEQELHHLRYRYVDVALDGPAAVSDFEAHFEPHVIEPPSANDVEAPEEVIRTSSPGVVNIEDFDSTLHFLDDQEVAYLRSEVEQAYASDLRQNVVSILLDLFESQADPAIRDEIVHVLDNMMLHFLSAAQFKTVAYILREAQIAAGRARDITPEQRDQLARVPDRLSEPEALSQLLQSLDEAHDLPPQEDLTALFSELRPYALATVFAWSARIQNARLRTLLQTAADRLAAANSAELARLVAHEDRDVAIAAMRHAGSRGSAAAVPPLAKRMLDEDAVIRRAAVQALAEIGSAGALPVLERALEDGDRDVRIVAARTLTVRSYRPALVRAESAVTGKALRGADRSEKMAVFELFGTLCGDRGVPILDQILNHRDLLRRHADPELRACAAVALGRVGTDAARTALGRAAAEKDVVVRTAVNKALRPPPTPPGRPA
jgi:hypothetical protein